MFRRILATGLALGIMGALGCTSVQKGTAAGGALGSGAGALIGHAIQGVGSGPGALVGLAVGATGGAIAADYYYGGADTAELAALQQQIDDLNNQLKAKDAQLADATAALEREKAQTQGLLHANDGRGGPDQPAVVATQGPDVQVTTKGDTTTFTILSAVLFNSGKATLTSQGRSALHKAAQMIRTKYPGSRIEVAGHTDNEPIKYSNYRSNYDLSLARARAVVRYMTETERLSSSLFTTVGYGESRPVASNDTAQGRQKNRRAEMIVRPKAVDVAAVEGS
jgi:chemotaxis protein MotB